MIELLQGVPMFAGLEDEALELLLEHTAAHEFNADDVIVREGETGNVMYIIGSGSVRIYKYFGTTAQTELGRLGAKEFFGEMCIIDPMPRTATVQAAEAAVLFSITAMAFHRLYQQMPRQHSILLLNMARDLVRRLRHIDEVFAARH